VSEPIAGEIEGRIPGCRPTCNSRCGWLFVARIPQAHRRDWGIRSGLVRSPRSGTWRGSPLPCCPKQCPQIVRGHH